MLVTGGERAVCKYISPKIRRNNQNSNKKSVFRFYVMKKSGRFGKSGSGTNLLGIDVSIEMKSSNLLA